MERDGEERVRGNVTLCPAKKSHPTTLLTRKKSVTSDSHAQGMVGLQTIDSGYNTFVGGISPR